ncbi:DUF3971 domain-containing protein [Sulfitobacter faviae]|uniref:DUF3971 domain-containing protein n=1 Tax=Sulfitobacter faviae TaxID=1775881 RepID=A0ABZ0UVI9_9RHOB|nr:DUF3971 domain-containing protein [Sulfitobacter faviae]WPZ20224.1 DUF3971 domain-containing protein [Sulfitobacter faviae]
MRDPSLSSPPAPDGEGPPRRRSRRRAGIVSAVVLVLLAALATGAAVYFTGRPIPAPLWVQTRIEARIASALPQARVDFGAMEFVVDEGWRPRVRLQDIFVTTPEGDEIVSFNEFKASLSMRSLLRGVAQPRAISLSGVVANLRRGADGRVSLSAGAGIAPPEREAATLPQLIGQIDEVLAAPALSALRSVELRALTLRFEDARAGRAWTGDGGRLRLSRNGDALDLSADLAVLSGGAGVATLTANYSSQIGENAATFGVTFDGVDARDIAAQGPAFSWLEVLRTNISGAVRSGIDSTGRFAPINASLQIGKGVLQPNPQTKPIPFDGAQSYFSYDPARQLLRFDEMSLDSPWVSGNITGSSQLGDVTGGIPGRMVGQFSLRDLRANPAEVYPETVALDQADIDFELSLNPFQLKLGRLEISDQGRNLRLDGALVAEAAGWNLSLDGRMDRLSPERLLALWPEGAKPKTRKWLDENLHAGRMRNLDMALRMAPGQAPQTYVAFDYAGAEVRFLKTLPHITDGSGHMSLLDNRLVVTVDAGEVIAPQGGAVTLDGSSFIIPDVRVKDGSPSVIRLNTRSTLTAALSLLNQPPMRVMDKAGLPVTLADGEAVLKGTLALPLKKAGKPEDVRYHFAGDLLALSTDTLVKDRSLQASSLSITADNDRITIGGAGRIDGVGFDGEWSQAIGPGSDESRLTAQVALTSAGLEAFGVALPPGSLRGEGRGQIAVDLKKGEAPRFTLQSDLAGLGVSVPQLSWSKAPGTEGELRLAGRLGETPNIDAFQFNAPGLRVAGSIDLAPGGTLDRVRIDRLRRGDWLDIPLQLIGQGKGNPVQVVLGGGTLDMRRAEFGAAEGQAGPPMRVALDRLQITDTIYLTDLAGAFDTAKGMDGAFTARLNGGTPVQGRVLPQAGRSAVRVVSDDAGGVLRSTGLVKQVVGGNLSLTLLPVGSGGAFDGQLTVSDVAIQDAPGIAALVNAISVVGLINELNGDGIYFDDVEANFRLTPNRLTLTEASAVGASLGLSMDGVYALDSGLIDMQGVISPVYMFNGIGSLFTRKGEGLIGFNYRLTGAAKDPSVSVNPLSALTPGMFRELFRRPPPQPPQVQGQANPVARVPEER